MVGGLLVNGFYLLGFGGRLGGEWFGICCYLIYIKIIIYSYFFN